MTVVTAYPSNYAPDGTGWTNPSYAYNNDGVQFATAPNPGRNKTIASRWGGLGLDSLIPAGATINSVTVNVYWKVSATGYNYDTLGFQPYVGGVAYGTEYTSTTETTTLALRTQQYTGLTRDNLLDANFAVRVRASQGATSGGFTASLDYVSVTVDYIYVPTLEVQEAFQAQDANNADLTARVNIAVDEGRSPQSSGPAEIPAFPMTGLLDDFNRPDDVTLGGNWYDINPGIGILSGQARGNGDSEFSINIGPGVEIYLSVYMGSNGRVGLSYAGGLEGDRYTLLAAVDPGGDWTIDLQKWVGGYSSTIISATVWSGAGIGIRHKPNGDISVYVSDGSVWQPVAYGNDTVERSGPITLSISEATVDDLGGDTIADIDNLTLTTNPAPSNDLVVQEASQSQVADNFDLTAVVNIAVDEASQTQVAETPALTAVATLEVQEAFQAQNANTPDISTSSALQVQDAAQGQTADNVALTALVNLAVDEATQTQSADDPVLSIVSSLVVQNALQAQAVDNVALSGTVTLEVQDAAQWQTAESPTLISQNILSVQDAAQSQTAENIELSVGSENTLAVQDAIQGQSADNVALTAKVNIAIQDGVQGQATDPITLTGTSSLVVSDGRQVQAAENVELRCLVQIVVQDSAQGQTAENVLITTGKALSVDKAVQGQTANNVDLTLIVNLEADDAVQLQVVDPIELSAIVNLPVTEGRQLVTSDNVTLTAIGMLEVDDAVQLQTADNVYLITGRNIPWGAGITLVVRVDNRAFGIILTRPETIMGVVGAMPTLFPTTGLQVNQTLEALPIIKQELPEEL